MKQILILIFIAAGISAFTQNKPAYWEDVEALRHFDNMYQYPAHPIVFVGSSSIRKWDGLQVAFGKYNVINRGIGGAVVNDITFYLNDLVFKYNPRQIVIYVGENDLVSDNVTADTVLHRTKKLFSEIRKKLPDTPVVYIAMKPSPSRDKFMPKAKAANALVQKFLSTEKNCVFVDIYNPMLKDGKSRPEFFVEDMLHMNQAGYALWEKKVKKYLLKKPKS